MCQPRAREYCSGCLSIEPPLASGWPNTPRSIIASLAGRRKLLRCWTRDCAFWRDEFGRRERQEWIWSSQLRQGTAELEKKTESRKQAPVREAFTVNRRIQHEVLDERRIRSRELIHVDARASVPEDPA